MLELILVFGILILDQAVKYWSDYFLSPVGTSIPIWEGVFNLTSTRNTGAAWGILAGKKWFFIIITIVVCGIMIYFLVRYHKKMHVLSRVALSLLLAGALGNFIDRAFLSYVRDMFHFCLIDFPIFNVADISLTCGTALLIIDVLFLKERSILAIDDKKRSANTEPGESVDEQNASATKDDRTEEKSRAAQSNGN